MRLDGEHERIRERFRSLRSEDELTAPSFDECVREAVSRAETSSQAAHTLRFAVAFLLVCAFAAALAALAIPIGSGSAGPAPAPRPVPEVNAPVSPPVMAERPDGANRPANVVQPERATDNLNGECASCPPVRKAPKGPKPIRRPKDGSRPAPETESCADC